MIFLFLYLFAAGAGIFAKTLLPVTGKNKYVSFLTLQGAFKDLSLEYNNITGVGIIRSVDGSFREIRVRTGSSFYVYNFRIEKILHQIIHKNNDLYLPPDVVEAILLNLVTTEVTYQYRDQYLELELGNRTEAKVNLKYVVVDPGHGGKDPGTADRNGNFEKDITLRVALILAKKINKQLPGIKTILTRTNDQFISLEKRAEIANHILKKNQDAVYISLHCNATLNPEPNGYEIYYFSQTATTEKARELALIENNIFGNKYSSPVNKIQADMLSSLIQRQSRGLAESIDGQMVQRLEKYIQKRGVKKADFAVLRGSLMPAILIEMGYLSNENDSFYLLNERVEEIIAKSVIRGIIEYAAKKKN